MHLLPVVDALLFEAQLPLQILDDGVLGSLNVRIGDGARRLGDRGLLGERFAEKTKQSCTSASEPATGSSSFLGHPVLIGSCPIRPNIPVSVLSLTSAVGMPGWGGWG